MPRHCLWRARRMNRPLGATGKHRFENLQSGGAPLHGRIDETGAPIGSGDDEAGRLGELDYLLGDASLEQARQPTRAAPTQHDEVGTARPGHGDDDAGGIADLGDDLDLADALFPRVGFDGPHEIPASLLQDLVFGPLHMFDLGQLAQLVARTALENGRHDVQDQEPRPKAMREIAGRFRSLGRVLRGIERDQNCPEHRTSGSSLAPLSDSPPAVPRQLCESCLPVGLALVARLLPYPPMSSRRTTTISPSSMQRLWYFLMAMAWIRSLLRRKVITIAWGPAKASSSRIARAALEMAQEIAVLPSLAQKRRRCRSSS